MKQYQYINKGALLSVALKNQCQKPRLLTYILQLHQNDHNNKDLDVQRAVQQRSH